MCILSTLEDVICDDEFGLVVEVDELTEKFVRFIIFKMAQNVRERHDIKGFRRAAEDGLGTDNLNIFPVRGLYSGLIVEGNVVLILR